MGTSRKADSNRIAALLAAGLIVGPLLPHAAPDGTAWSEDEVDLLASLSIHNLPSLPRDPSNRYADDPAAAAFGHRLFFEPRLSSTGTISCASCHLPDRQFQDDVALGVGVGRTDRRTMPLAGTAYSPFLFWDGRKDSHWAQALGPLESPVEHGGTRAGYVHTIREHHAAEYEAIFGSLPDLSGVPRSAGPETDPPGVMSWNELSASEREDVTAAFVNIGKALAAYQRQLRFGPSRFDHYVEELLTRGRTPTGLLSDDEVAGLRLFVGKASCVDCHNGPLFTNNDFHNTGVPAVPGLPEDSGRIAGARAVLEDEFNCRSRWSDAEPNACTELEFMVADGPELVRAYKVPTLRNVADRAPYMHAGQISSLDDVVEHYSRAPKAPAGHSELRRLDLSIEERQQLVAFLRALSGPLASDSAWLEPPDR